MGFLRRGDRGTRARGTRGSVSRALGRTLGYEEVGWTQLWPSNLRVAKRIKTYFANTQISAGCILRLFSCSSWLYCIGRRYCVHFQTTRDVMLKLFLWMEYTHWRRRCRVPAGPRTGEWGGCWFDCHGGATGPLLRSRLRPAVPRDKMVLIIILDVGKSITYFSNVRHSKRHVTMNILTSWH